MVEPDIDHTEKQTALSSVLGSAEFAGAERLKAFLSYVIREDLDGRAASILGKTILEDVYRKGPVADGNPESVVRVDATRLRQRLDIYYGSTGRDDPVRIHIDKGGYAPRYERRASPKDAQQIEPATAFASPALRLAAGSLLVVLSLTIVFFAVSSPDTGTPPTDTSPAARAALFENAPTTLLARNMVQEARGLLFPAAEMARVSSALEMFKEATRLDPSYYGGYAGAAQAAVTLAGLSQDPTERERLLGEADELAERALALDRTKAWGHSSEALVHLVRRDFAAADQSSATALQLEPGNLHALEIDAIIAFFSGDFERAIQSADPKLHRNRTEYGLPWRNALGNAYFHTGEYGESILALTEAVRTGGPVSEINTAHLIASYQASGDREKAAELVEAFNTSWPDSRVSLVLRKLFEDAENAERVLNQMTAAGWVDPAIRPQ